jgi:hypothetical protein
VWRRVGLNSRRQTAGTTARSFGGMWYNNTGAAASRRPRFPLR